jgi:flagellar basal-body rod protein FlgC
MSLFSIFDIAGSGMSAQTLRLNTTASNLANAESVSGSQEAAYRAHRPVFASFKDALDQSAAGVRVVTIAQDAKPAEKQYQPDHPLARW